MNNTVDDESKIQIYSKLEEMKKIMGDVFEQLIPAYISQSDEMISHMPDTLASNDISSLERYAHSMKSSSLNVGAIKLSEISKTLEDMARNRDSNEKYNNQINLLTVEYRKVKTILQQYLNNEHSA